MRQLYIGNPKTVPQAFRTICRRPCNCTDWNNFAEHQVNHCFFVHNAEFPFAEKNLILIGTACSYLAVILPNMDPGTGGECG